MAKLRNRIKRLIYLRYYLRRFKGAYDIVHIQELNLLSHRSLWRLLKKVGRKIIVSPYGSDFYRVSVARKLRYAASLDDCAAITFISERMRDDFISFYKKYEKQSRICRFGSETTQFIDQVKGLNRESMALEFSFPLNKIYVVCGYNGSPGQQHEQIITVLQDVVKDHPSIKNKCVFIFPMAYSHMQWRNKVERLLAESGLDYLIMKEMLNPEQVAKLRVLTDVMINVLVTDQLSSSMVETLYAGGVVINGAWLPYLILQEQEPQAFYLTAVSIEAVGRRLADVVAHLESYQLKCLNNKNAVSRFICWDETIAAWEMLYTELGNC